MQLSELLLERELNERISYDRERKTTFLNLEGYQIRSKDDVNRIVNVIEELFHSVGSRFAMVINYDGVYIDPLVMDYHAERIVYVEKEFYTSCTRYSGGAFLRMKLGKALEKRKVAPHLFESDKQARKALSKYLDELSEIKAENDDNVISITGKS